MPEKGNLDAASQRADERAMGTPAFFPDHTRERTEEFSKSTPAERVAQAIRLSRTATRIAASAQTDR